MRVERDRRAAGEAQRDRPSPHQERVPVENELQRRGLPAGAGNQAVARLVGSQRRPAVQHLLRRPLPAETPSTATPLAVFAPAGASPTEVAQQLGGDYDGDHPASEAGAATATVATAMARLEGLRVSQMLTALQILRVNGSPAWPGSRNPLSWLVSNRASAAPRTRIAISAIARPAEVNDAEVAALTADDAREVKAFLELGSWDDAMLGLPRKGTPGAGALTDRQRDQIEYIRRRRDVVADRGRAVFRNRRGLEYDASPGSDPTPGGAAAGTLEAEIWRELDLEGGASAVNTYDDQKFTWGKGWSALSTLPAIVDRFLTDDPAAKQELMEAGFTHSEREGKWLFVDVGAQHVLVGTEALDAFKADRKFVSLLTHLTEDPEHQQHFVDAQWAQLSSGGRAGDVPAAIRKAWPATWSTQSVRFAAHCVHWGYSWGQLAAAGPDIKNLIRWIARRKGTADPSGAWTITGWASATIRHFSNGVAQSQMTAPAPLPKSLDPAAFYFQDGADTYRVWKP